MMKAVCIRSRRIIAWCLVLLTTGFLCGLPARAQAPATSQAAREAELKAAYEAGAKAGTRGPAKIVLLDQAGLSIPADYMFIPKAEGTRIMRALGNAISEASLDGIIVGLKQTDDWIVVVRYIKEGYIKDDEAKNWKSDELLQTLKDGTEESNKDRLARGFPELEVIGWIEQPTYDPASHRLVWSLLNKLKGAPDTDTKGINYNTYALGRDGYFSLNLLTDSDHVETDKAVARTLLAALSYNDGKRYEDFNVSTDHIAAYGIAALVGGLAAKKLGLLALIGVFALKFAKLIGIGIAAFMGGVWKLFGRKRSNV
jgi:uncharacterized membrane-anchored protein